MKQFFQVLWFALIGRHFQRKPAIMLQELLVVETLERRLRDLLDNASDHWYKHFGEPKALEHLFVLLVQIELVREQLQEAYSALDTARDAIRKATSLVPMDHEPVIMEGDDNKKH